MEKSVLKYKTERMFGDKGSNESALRGYMRGLDYGSNN